VYLPVAGGADVDGWAWLSLLLFYFLSRNQMVDSQTLHLSLAQLTDHASLKITLLIIIIILEN
jgi:hypothetical protein